METTMTKEMAMSAVREICTRPWRGVNTAHAGTFRSDQGRTVSFAIVVVSIRANPPHHSSISFARPGGPREVLGTG